MNIHMNAKMMAAHANCMRMLLTRVSWWSRSCRNWLTSSPDSSAVLFSMDGVSTDFVSSFMREKICSASSAIALLVFTGEVLFDEGDRDAGEAAFTVFPYGVPWGIRQVGHAYEFCSAEGLHAAYHAV